jgi:hypothetical protein
MLTSIPERRRDGAGAAYKDLRAAVHLGFAQAPRCTMCEGALFVKVSKCTQATFEQFGICESVLKSRSLSKR